MELARGKVGDRPWGATLAALWRRHLTGQLSLVLGTERFTIALVDGAVVGAVSPLTSESAARLAVDAGLAPASQLGELLSLVAPDDIEAVATQIELPSDRAIAFRRFVIARRAARTFAFEVGDFTVEDTVTVATRADCAIDTRAVIYIGARDMIADDRLIADLRRLGERFRLADDASLSQFNISDAPLDKLRAGFTLDDLSSHAERAIVYALACTRDCVVEEEASAPEPRRMITPATMRSGMPYAKRDSSPPDNVLMRTQTPRLGVPVVSSYTAPQQHTTDRISVKATSKITPPFGVPIRSTTPPPEVPKTEEAHAAYHRAALALGTGEHEAAISDLTLATELEPNRAEYLATLAWAKFCASSDKQAIAEQTRRALTEATTKTANPVLPLYYLACVARDLDREREALRLFQRVLHLDPEHREARREVVALMQRTNKKGLLDRLRR